VLISHLSYSSYYYYYSTRLGRIVSQYFAVLKILEILQLQNLTLSQERNKDMHVVLPPKGDRVQGAAKWATE
jgi:hypothetical protein